MPDATSDIQRRLEDLRSRLAQSCIDCARQPEQLSLMAVSKTRPAADIRAALQAGQKDFGENYLQEALDKMDELAESAGTASDSIVWHFIGPIQSNKTRDIATRFDWVHSVDREKIARRLSAQRPDDKPPLQVCIQVNISREDSKSGVMPEATAPLARIIQALPGLHLRGLMAIPRVDRSDPGSAFARLRELQIAVNSERGDSPELDTLSMGMSDDYVHAIAEGATIVRIGTALFGPRH